MSEIKNRKLRHCVLGRAITKEVLDDMPNCVKMCKEEIKRAMIKTAINKKCNIMGDIWFTDESDPWCYGGDKLIVGHARLYKNYGFKNKLKEG